MSGNRKTFEPYKILCRQGDPSSDLFFLESGRLLICTIQGTEVKALARIEPGQFVGELSFFDGMSRASHVVTLEKCVITTLTKTDLTSLLPGWYMEIGKNLTKKIRLLDHIAQETRLKKIGSDDQKQLSIDEQRKIYQIITNQ